MDHKAAFALAFVLCLLSSLSYMACNCGDDDDDDDSADDDDNADDDIDDDDQVDDDDDDDDDDQEYAFFDDFESYPTNAPPTDPPWSLSVHGDGYVKVMSESKNQVLDVNAPTDYDRAYAKYENIARLQGTVVMEWDFQPLGGDSVSFDLYQLQMTGWKPQAYANYWYGHLFAWNGHTSTDCNETLTTGTWYALKIELDVPAMTYNVYLDGALTDCADMGVYTPDDFNGIHGLEISNLSTYAGRGYVDNLKLYAELPAQAAGE